MNEPVLVEARCGRNGRLHPRSFRWRERRYTVASVGRQWTADGETHLLVMVVGGGTFELTLAASTGAWRLVRSPQELGPRTPA